LVRRKSDSSNSSKDRFQQFRISACLHQPFGHPKQIVLEHDGKLRAIFEGSDHLAIQLNKKLGKGLCFA
jgi:hypothetical protein